MHNFLLRWKFKTMGDLEAAQLQGWHPAADGMETGGNVLKQSKGSVRFASSKGSDMTIRSPAPKKVGNFPGLLSVLKIQR
jgi:hypothetical protein